jgi:predicted  nucleic acid-binding Zn-ribbon protein
MSDENTTDILEKYVKMKEEYDALTIKIGALETDKKELETAYENAKGEIGKLQGLVTRYVVTSEPDKTDDTKEKTIRDIIMDEYDKIEKGE